uniref:Integrase catalytic domain-containing protein n=1 Tax=Lactuca sativa TaxID=4236 RepID=A0A9R1VYH8_LACSA|nr:hypothetical protein LSAT_V11C400157850 [Lactuca sativa]
MSRALKARNKLGFVDGTCKKSSVDASKQIKWDRANAVVCSWLLSSVSDSIYQSQAYSDIAEDVWNSLFETYNKSDGSVVFNIHQQINNFKQNGISLSDYFNRLDSLWKEFDGLTSLTECTCEAAVKQKDHSNLMKLMQFLSGLDDSYSQVKSHILLMEPLPSVKTAFSILSREESLQRNGSLGSLQSFQTSSKSQSTAFNSRFNNKFNSNSSNKNKSQIVQCKNCGIKGHSIDKCYKIIGYPKDFKQKNDFNSQKSFSVNSATTSSGSSSVSNSTDSVGDSEFHQLTKEQYIKFLQLINDKQVNEEASASANMAGTCLFQAFSSSVNNQKWIVDSGANQHMIASKSLLHDNVDVSQLNLLVSHPNGTSAKIEKIGNMNMTNSLTLFDVFAVPDFNVNLLSVHKVCKDSTCEVIFNEHGCKIQGLQSKVMVGNGRESGGLYYMNNEPSGNSLRVNNSSSFCCVSKLTWHNRLGHPSDQALFSLKQKLNFENDILPPCDVCHKAKQTRESFPVSQHVTSDLGELIHLDVWGPYRVTTVEGFRYFLTIVDDFTRATWVYLLKSKDEVYECVMLFFNILLNQFEVKIKTVKSDNGTEFLNNKMRHLFESKGIIHQTSCVHTPQQNGVVERKHRHILNVARSLIFQSGLPLKYWGEAVLTSVFLINRTPTSVLKGASPYELVYKSSPVFDRLRVFGCLCFATKLNNLDKFSERADKCVFLGYSSDKKGYKVLSLDSNLVFVSRDVKFYESVFPLKLKSSSITNKYNDPLSSSDPFSYDDSLYSSSLLDSSRVDNLRDVHQRCGASADQYLDETNLFDVSNQTGEAHVPSSGEMFPSTSTMSEESGQDNTNSLEGDQSIRTTRSGRTVHLPAKFSDYIVEGKHKFGIEKTVNYSLLDNENLCFVSNLNKTVEPKTYSEAALDTNWIKTMNDEMEALYRNNTWEITDLPKGRKPIGCRWIYKIKYKSNGEIERFKARLVAKGYSQREGIDYEETFSPVAKMVSVRVVLSLAVHCSWPLFQLDVNNAFLYGDLSEDVYMSQPEGYHSKDDIIITGNSNAELENVKNFLKSQFFIKDLGELKYFLGIEVIKTDKGVCLNQRKYCLELLHEFGMLAYKPVKTPLETNLVLKRELDLDKSDCVVNITEFQKLIGKLIYLTMTRPDISYAVHILSQYTHKPQKSHLKVAFRLLRYLKNCPGKGVHITKDNSLNITAYVDADWAKCLFGRRSVTGFLVYFGNSLVTGFARGFMGRSMELCTRDIYCVMCV